MSEGKQKVNISLDTNIVKIAAESFAKIKLNPTFLKKLDELEQKSSKIRKKKYHLL